MYHLTVFALPNALLAALVLVWAGWVRRVGGPSRMVLWGALLSLAVALWQGGMALSYSSGNARLAQQWIDLAQVGLLLIPPLAHGLFSHLFRFRARWHRINGLLWIASVTFAALLLGGIDFFRSPYHYPWGYYAHYGAAGTLAAGYLALVLAYLLALGFVRHRQSPAGSVRQRRGRLILAGVGLALGSFADVLPAWGIASYPFGYAALAASLVVLGYAAWRYRLVPVTPETSAKNVLSSLNDGVLVLDEVGCVALVNERAREMLGGFVGEVLGYPVAALVAQLGLTGQLDAETLQNPGSGFHEVAVIDGEGRQRFVRLSGRGMRSRYGEPLLTVWVLHDVTAYREAVRNAEYFAYCDPVTALPNRRLLLDRLAQSLARIRGAHREQLFVVILGVDRLQRINDTFGYAVGDVVMRETAARLREVLRPEDTLARLDSDRFAIVREASLDDRRRIQDLVSRISRAVAAEVEVGAGAAPVAPRVKAGVSVSRGRSGDPETLLREADTALEQARCDPGEGMVFFQAEMNVASQEALLLERELRQALAHGDLEVYYQPVIAIDSGAIVGFEALVRWNHVERGLLAPGAFIGLAEESGLIMPIGEYVMARAVRQVASWHNALAEDARPGLSLNVSPRQLQAGSIAEKLAGALDAGAMSPACVTIEITESAMMGETAQALRELQAIRALGAKLSLDDFGTGYASLSYLQRFPVTELKIDRTFVDGLGVEAGNSAIVRAMVALAHGLELNVVAEGVETANQFWQLRQLGCDAAQGFLFGRPMPAAQAWALLQAAPTGDDCGIRVR